MDTRQEFEKGTTENNTVASTTGGALSAAADDEVIALHTTEQEFRMFRDRLLDIRTVPHLHDNGAAIVCHSLVHLQTMPRWHVRTDK
jgi:hypothetical protein